MDDLTSQSLAALVASSDVARIQKPTIIFGYQFTAGSF